MRAALGIIGSGYMAAAAPFDPTSIAGCSGWWDASDAASFTYSSTTIVSQWNDRSGGARHVSQATVANQPNRNGLRNGLSTVVFDSIDYLQYVGTTGVNVGNVTIFAVFAESAAVTNAGVLVVYNTSGNDYSTGGCVIVTSSDTNNVMDILRINPGRSAVAGSGVTPWATYTGTAKSDGTFDSYKNGVQGTVFTTQTGTFTVADGGYLVGGRKNGGTYFGQLKGDIGEMIFYNSVLSTTDRQTVENYLRTKWGTG